MELGERIRSARLQAGLSQRQLCDGIITRNMLSQIENGSASPSMDTLCRLARRLEKPVSALLDEEAVTSPNAQCMAAARSAYRQGDYSKVCSELAAFRMPDETFQEEARLLLALAETGLAEAALTDGKRPYAAELLARAASRKSLYWTEALERQRQLLLARISPDALPPADDRELLLRAENALRREDFRRAEACLEAAEDHSSPLWNLLRGEVFLHSRCWKEAADCYRRAEDFAPETAAARLEQCFRELEDFKNAYLYACKLREITGNR